MVSRDVYREQKNFIRINRVEDSYSRLPFSNSKEYKRVDFQRDETVTGVPAIETRKVISHDEKKQWEVKNVKLLCNLQFYLSDDFVLHNRNLYSWLDLIEDFGGFYQMFIIAIFVILGSNINKQILMSKLVRSLYYVEKSDKTKKSVIKFSTFDKFKHMVLPNYFLARSDNIQDQIYTQGRRMVESDLNMFSLMESLHKIKATLSVLVGQDKCKLDQIQQLYAKQTTIIPNHPSSINTEYSEYLEFLQRDEREKIEKYEAEAHHDCCEIDFKVLPKEKIEEKQIIQNEIDLKITIDLEKKCQEEEQKDEQKKSSVQ